MRSLITGGAGFIGSHLADRLVERGDAVLLLDDLSTGRHSNVEHLLDEASAELVLGSVVDAPLVDELVSRVDVVFHLAAAVGVELIVQHPVESLRTNILGSEIVIEKAYEHDRPVLVTSTSEIYGKNASDLLGEDDDRILGSPLTSRWSYSEAKAVAEILAFHHHRQKGLRTVIARLFNTVGPRQTGRYGMVVPRFVNQALRGEALTVYGDGQQSRCFCHVDDVVRALIGLMEEDRAVGNVYNVGSRDEVTIEALAHRIIAMSGSSSGIRYVPYEEAYEEGFEDMRRRVPDTGRIEALLDWAPRLDLDDIIRVVIDDQRS